ARFNAQLPQMIKKRTVRVRSPTAHIVPRPARDPPNHLSEPCSAWCYSVCKSSLTSPHAITTTPRGDMGIQEERAELERALAGQTICTALAETAQRHGDLPAYSDRVDGEWKTLTWAETRTRALETAAGFAALGLEPGDVVALMMPNRSEHVLADLGAVHAGGTPTTVYATLAPDQVAFVAGDCSAKYAVLNGKDQLDRWEPVLDRLPGLRKIIVVEAAVSPSGNRYMTGDGFAARGGRVLAPSAAEIDRRWKAVKPGDTVTLLYTSGTTGNPKG